MPKGPEIGDDIILLLTRFHKEHPNWTNKKLRMELLKILRREEEYKALVREYPGWPSEFTIDKLMPGIRRFVREKQASLNQLDSAWTIQSVAKHPIPPESLQAVLRAWLFMQKFRIEVKQITSDALGPPPLTIRQAQWVARLYACVPGVGLREEADESAVEDVKALLWCSMVLADLERQAEDAGLDYLGSQWTTLEVFGKLTSRTFTREEMEGITGLKGHYVTRVSTDDARRYLESPRKRMLPKRKR